MSQIRYRVDPGDVPPEKAARRLHLTLVQFNELLPRLLLRGFPPADRDTGNYDLDAIDAWRQLRHVASTTSNEMIAEKPSMGDRFISAMEQRRRERADKTKIRRRPKRGEQ